MTNDMEIRISGLGGQGVILAGQILGKAATYSGKNAVQTQSYGAEARGSAAKSEVIISSGKIGFPIIRKCDVLIAMSQEAVEKNVKDLREGGILLVDSSTIEVTPKIKAEIFKIPATETSKSLLGEKLYANIVMLGALNKITGVVNDESMEKAIRNTFRGESGAINMNAYEKGKELVSEE